MRSVMLLLQALWRNVHSLAVATDLHYNSMGFFRKADFKVGGFRV